MGVAAAVGGMLFVDDWTTPDEERDPPNPDDGESTGDELTRLLGLIDEICWPCEVPNVDEETPSERVDEARGDERLRGGVKTLEMVGEGCPLLVNTEFDEIPV